MLNGESVSTVADGGVVRLRGTIPAVLCSWFDERVGDVEVAHAPDAAGYAELVAGSHAVDQPGNEQTEQDVVVDGRTIRVVRIVYPTSPSAGVSLNAALLDEGSRGRVRLQVHRTHLIDGYDEQAVARDLLAFLDSSAAPSHHDTTNGSLRIRQAASMIFAARPGPRGSGAEEGLDGAAFVHGPVAFGGLVEGRGEVEDRARVDLLAA